MRNMIAETFQLELPASLLFDYPTVETLTNKLNGAVAETKGPIKNGAALNKTVPTNNVATMITSPLKSAASSKVLIEAAACRFSTSYDMFELWEILRDGRDCLTSFPSCRGVCDYPAAYCHGADMFDAEFFDISSREAVAMDPQHRIILEMSWEVTKGRVGDDVCLGVFIGIGVSDYMIHVLGGGDHEMSPFFASGLSGSTASGRVSYILDARGPSMSIDTACSSALVAVIEGVRSVNGTGVKALCGGTSVIATSKTFLMLEKNGMLAADGRCKTFDASANGYGRGEGGGVVLLGTDNCSGGEVEIAGAAIVQDGRTAGLTAPNGLAQEEVILRACKEMRDVVGVVEVGDPVEIHSLARALSRTRSALRPLLVGSSKTNLGHTEAAAGILGLLKACLALKRKELPRHLNLRSLNPVIGIDVLQSGLITVPLENTTFSDAAVGVSAFGMSGTNAHICAVAGERDVRELWPRMLALWAPANTMRAANMNIYEEPSSYEVKCVCRRANRVSRVVLVSAESVKAVRAKAQMLSIAGARPETDRLSDASSFLLLAADVFVRKSYWFDRSAARGAAGHRHSPTAKDVLLQCLSTTLGRQVSQFEESLTFQELGLDSLMMFDVLEQVEFRTGCAKISPSLLVNYQTPLAMQQYLSAVTARGTSGASASVLNTRTLLLAFPPLGVSTEYDWSNKVPEHFTVKWMFYDLMDPESEFNRLAQVVLGSSSAIESILLVGHSLGAWVAYEVAIRLVRHPELVDKVRLCISSALSPHDFKGLAQKFPFFDMNLNTKTVAECSSLKMLLVKAGMLAPFRSCDLEKLWNNCKFICSYELSTAGVEVPLLVVHAVSDNLVQWDSILKWEDVALGSIIFSRVEGDHSFFEEPPLSFFESLRNFTSSRTVSIGRTKSYRLAGFQKGWGRHLSYPFGLAPKGTLLVSDGNYILLIWHEKTKLLPGGSSCVLSGSFSMSRNVLFLETTAKMLKLFLQSDEDRGVRLSSASGCVSVWKEPEAKVFAASPLLGAWAVTARKMGKTWTPLSGSMIFSAEGLFAVVIAISPTDIRAFSGTWHGESGTRTAVLDVEVPDIVCTAELVAQSIILKTPDELYELSVEQTRQVLMSKP